VLSKKPKYILLPLGLSPDPTPSGNLRSCWFGEHTNLGSEELWEDHEPHFLPSKDQSGYVFVRRT
jgi:hypothetical protein